MNFVINLTAKKIQKRKRPGILSKVTLIMQKTKKLILINNQRMKIKIFNNNSQMKTAVKMNNNNKEYS